MIVLGQVFDPGIVAVVGAIANCLAALVEYDFITWLFSKAKLRQQVETSRIFQRFAHYFQRAAFACLIVTGLTPIPFEPFRLAAILIRYSLPKYLLSVFIGRFIRYYLLAWTGHVYSKSVLNCHGLRRGCNFCDKSVCQGACYREMRAWRSLAVLRRGTGEDDPEIST